MRSSPPTAIADADVRDHAARLLGAPVALSALALAFEETTATSASVHVEGRNFYPPMLHDIASATSSIHVNQFGFRPGEIGEAFASTLLAKAAEGVRVRMVVDRQGSDPDRSSRAFYDRLLDGGIEVCVVRAAQPRAVRGPLGAEGEKRWNLDQLGHIDHRKVVVVDGLTGWVGGAGVEDHFQDGRFHDMFLRLTGPVVSQLQLVFLATLRWLGGDLDSSELAGLFPEHPGTGDGRARGRPAQRSREVPADHGCHRERDGRRNPDARRREPVRHRPIDDPTDDGRGAARCAGAALRPCEREQLGVRGGAAVPPPSAPRVGGRDPRVPGDAAREGLRPRRGGRPPRDVQAWGNSQFYGSGQNWRDTFPTFMLHDLGRDVFNASIVDGRFDDVRVLLSHMHIGPTSTIIYNVNLSHFSTDEPPAFQRLGSWRSPVPLFLANPSTAWVFIGELIKPTSSQDFQYVGLEKTRSTLTATRATLKSSDRS